MFSTFTPCNGKQAGFAYKTAGNFSTINLSLKLTTANRMDEPPPMAQPVRYQYQSTYHGGTGAIGDVSTVAQIIRGFRSQYLGLGSGSYLTCHVDFSTSGYPLAFAVQAPGYLLNKKDLKKSTSQPLSIYTNAHVLQSYAHSYDDS